MPEFTYNALTRDGRHETATIVAASAAAAGHMLKEKGLLPTELKEKRAIAPFLEQLKNIGTIPLAEKINFVENLSIMLKAGISVSRGLNIQKKQTRNSRFKVILNDIAQQVESGKSLGDAIAKYPKIFSNIFVSMIRVGELSGNLEKSLEYLSIQLQRDANLRSKVKGAMIYPSVIVGAMVIIGVLMSIFVLPQLTSVFKEFSGELPLSTKVVIAIADLMGGHAVLAIGLMVGLIGSVTAFLRTPNGERSLDFVLLHFYIINTIVKKINLARFSRILSSLLKSGIPIVQALEVAADSMGNVYYKELLQRSSRDVKLGRPLTEALGSDTNLFPVLVVQMLQVGEESGAVEEILSQLAGHYEEEVDDTLKNLSSIIEPLLLLVIGGVVGLLAMALISPIYQISQSIQ
ncbi:MAG: type II secretion system F family protein [Patescibacteria group bacterium]|nr:type II secretion system F family protein [Patescibacteria group bacterium]